MEEAEAGVDSKSLEELAPEFVPNNGKSLEEVAPDIVSNGGNPLKNQLPITMANSRKDEAIFINQTLLRPQVYDMVVKPPTWGKKPRPNFGRRRPRPISGVYLKGAPPNPLGSGKYWPFTRYPNVPIDPFPEPLVFSQPAPTNNPKVDDAMKSLIGNYCRIMRVRYFIYMKSAKIPKSMVNCQKEMDSLWAQLKDLRDAAAKNRETLGELGAIVVQEPAWFSYRTFGVNQGLGDTQEKCSETDVLVAENALSETKTGPLSSELEEF